MKKIIWIITLVVTIFCTSGLLNAQSSVAAMEKTRLGFGVALGKEVLMMEEMFDLNQVDFPSFYIPIIFPPAFRIEPEFGYFRYKFSNSTEEKYTLMVLGCGLFFTQWIGSVDLYFGARVGMLRSSYSTKTTFDSQSSEHESKKTDWMYGPAVGGEYFFTSHLSFGGEIQFNFIKIGEWEAENSNNARTDTETEHSESIMRTKTLFFVRWYL